MLPKPSNDKKLAIQNKLAPGEFWNSNHYHPSQHLQVCGLHIHGLVQGRRNPSALALELRLSSINPLMSNSLVGIDNITEKTIIRINLGSLTELIQIYHF